MASYGAKYCAIARGMREGGCAPLRETFIAQTLRIKASKEGNGAARKRGITRGAPRHLLLRHLSLKTSAAQLFAWEVPASTYLAAYAHSRAGLIAPAASRCTTA